MNANTTYCQLARLHPEAWAFRLLRSVHAPGHTACTGGLRMVIDMSVVYRPIGNFFVITLADQQLSAEVERTPLSPLQRTNHMNEQAQLTYLLTICL